MSDVTDIDAICDEAVKLTEQAVGGRPLWQAAYHGAMLMRAAMHEASPVQEGDLVEQIARAICDEQFGSEAFDRLEPRLQHFRNKFMRQGQAVAAIVQERMDALERENAELIHDVGRQMTIANVECNEAEEFREALREARKMLAMQPTHYRAQRAAKGRLLARIDAALASPIKDEVR